MTLEAIQSDSASSQPLAGISRAPSQVRVVGTDDSTRIFTRAFDTNRTTRPCVVYTYAPLSAQPVANHFSDFDAFVAELESDPESAEKLSEGRKWVGQTFYAGNATLAALRLAAGLSQKQLADACGLGQPHISRYESAKIVPGIDISGVMARALGVDLGVFEAAWTRSRAELTDASTS